MAGLNEQQQQEWQHMQQSVRDELEELKQECPSGSNFDSSELAVDNFCGEEPENDNDLASLRTALSGVRTVLQGCRSSLKKS